MTRQSNVAFPHDIIRQVASHLDPTSIELQHLCLLDKASFLLLNPILYRHVVFKPLRNPFCNSRLILKDVFPDSDWDNQDQITETTTIKEYLSRNIRKLTIILYPHEELLESRWQKNLDLRELSCPNVETMILELDRITTWRRLMDVRHILRPYNFFEKVYSKKLIIRNFGFHTRTRGSDLEDFLHTKTIRDDLEHLLWPKRDEVTELYFVIEEEITDAGTGRGKSRDLGILGIIMYLGSFRSFSFKARINFILATKPTEKFRTHPNVKPGDIWSQYRRSPQDDVSGWLHDFMALIPSSLVKSKETAMGELESKDEFPKVRFIGFERLDEADLEMPNAEETEVEDKFKEWLKISLQSAGREYWWSQELIDSKIYPFEVLSMRNWLLEGEKDVLNDELYELWKNS